MRHARCAFHRDQASSAQILPAGLKAQCSMKRLEHLRRGLITHGCRTQSGSRECRPPGSPGALAADVADQEYPAVWTMFEHVVEVATDFVQLAGSAVARS